MEYVLQFAILIAIYGMLGSSLNLLWGYTGLLSLAQAAFFGIGAYTVALTTAHVSGSFFTGLVVGMAVAALLATFIGGPAIRIHDDYFVIATFALQVVVFSVFQNWISLTGGPMGIAGVSRPAVPGFVVTSNLGLAVLVGVFWALTIGIEYRLMRSPFGRVLRGIREDDVRVLALGKNVAAFKLFVSVLAAVVGAVAGSLHATYMSFVDPSSFTPMESIFIVSLLIVGGSGRILGPVVGAAVLVGLPEALRWLGPPSSVAANLRQVSYGSLLVTMMLFRPQGLIGRRLPSQ